MDTPFPLPLDAYPVPPTGAGLWEILQSRAAVEPFNLIATGIFGLAILHTFAAPPLARLAYRVQHAHEERRRAAGLAVTPSVRAEFLHFTGEVEVVFGLWCLVLAAAMTVTRGFAAAAHYFDHTVDYTEALFVFVIMALASTKPVLDLAEDLLQRVAALGSGSPAAWWFTLLTLGPLLGSFITEPAAMTITAMLLSKRFFSRGPSTPLSYATLGLLFVNVSIGGTLTPFAAPPVLMVARPWNWDFGFMFTTFGLRAIAGVVAANLTMGLLFRRELMTLTKAEGDETRERAPWIVVAAHLAFMAWTVANVHHPALFVGGFLFFLGFAKATAAHQNAIDLKAPLLVAFFLGGLVVHGGLQGWWIQPVLGRLSETPLFFGALALTAFNDNALITFLATLVPDLNDAAKYAVVAGAVAGGGLTVIANAPNPAGQAILARHFEGGISPLLLLAGAAVPTAIVCACLLAG